MSLAIKGGVNSNVVQWYGMISFSVVYEWNKHEAVLNLGVQVVWERIGRQVYKEWQVPKAVLHVDANLSPGDIALRGANPSKVSFLFTGSEVSLFYTRFSIIIFSCSRSSLKHFLSAKLFNYF